MSSYAICVIDNANKNAINRVFNLMNSDIGDNLSQPLSATGADPATNWMGGWPVTAAQANVLQTLVDNLPSPPGGWPYSGVTLAQATTAAGAMYVNVNTGADAELLPSQNLATVLAAKGLKRIEPPM